MSPRDTRRAAWGAYIAELREAVGRTPADQLRWLLGFAYDVDVARLTAEERARLRSALALVLADASQGRWAVAQRADQPPGLASEAELRGAQQAIRQAVEAIVSGRLYHRKVTVHLFARYGPRGIPAPPIPRERVRLVQHLIPEPWPEIAAIAALELLGQVPPTALRRCPYVIAPRGPAVAQPDLPFGACGRVFVAQRRQKYCDVHRELARQAALQRAQERFRERHRRARRRLRQRGARRGR